MTKAAVVGVGHLGTYHAEKYARLKEADLVALVDVEEGRGDKLAKKLKTSSVRDYRELPALGVECASVAVPTSQHYEVAAWLLQHGIDVLLEKPMTATSEEARDLIAIAERHSRILQVGHLERFNPAFRAMKKVLTQPWFFEARRIAPFSGRGHDVDVVLDLMIHDIDIISHLVGQPVARIDAVGIPVLTGTVDIANARLTFEGGAVANVTASRAAFKSERTIRIFQPDLYISLNYEKKTLKIVKKTGERDLLGFPKMEWHEERVEERDALEDEIEAFLTAVRHRTSPVVTGYDGLAALELAGRIRAALSESLVRLGDPSAEYLKAGNE